MYFANLTAINRIQLSNIGGPVSNPVTAETIFKNGTHIRAIDLDRKGARIFWTDLKSKQIFRMNLDGSDPKPIVGEAVGLCEGIAYDYATDKIYWTDSTHNLIEVAQSDGSNRKVLIRGDMEQPRGIVVHGTQGYVI